MIELQKIRFFKKHFNFCLKKEISYVTIIMSKKDIIKWSVGEVA